MFRLSPSPIDSKKIADTLVADESGAIITFEGRVRNHQDGKKVLALEYEAYEDLAMEEAKKIIAEASQKFKVQNIDCVHRVGKLDIREIALWVGVSAAHRDAAFQACRYVVDEIKARLPIWKKEYFEDGTTQWVNCQEKSRVH